MVTSERTYAGHRPCVRVRVCVKITCYASLLLAAGDGAAVRLICFSHLKRCYVILDSIINRRNGSTNRDTYRGMPDNESGLHTQGCVLTQKRPVLRRGVHKAKNIYMAFCIYKCAVPT